MLRSSQSQGEQHGVSLAAVHAVEPSAFRPPRIYCINRKVYHLNSNRAGIMTFDVTGTSIHFIQWEP